MNTMQENQQNPPADQHTAAVPQFKYFPFFNSRQAAFVIALLAVLFYSPSYFNEYALDDGITIHQNDHVIRGVRGIKDILTKDLYHGFYRRMNAKDQLQGGRYRPLSAISFAIEQEIIGPYRTGYYMFTEDLNKNGKLDNHKVFYRQNSQTAQNYEYNYFTDLDNDGVAQAHECYTCWDLNKNFTNDTAEDLNVDGVFNEVDCQVYGASVRHFNNIWLYALACLLVFHLLSVYIFRERQDLAFLAALLFTIHPVHSEVVANVRGRDDIFSMIFIALTFIFAFRYVDRRSLRSLVAAAVFFFLACMSKEYAPVLYLLVPCMFYIFRGDKFQSRNLLAPFLVFLFTALIMILIDVRALHFWPIQYVTFLLIAVVFCPLILLLFRNAMKAGGTPALMISLYIAGIFYLVLRLHATNFEPGVPDTEILNNPYLLATGEEKLATKIYGMLVYLRLSVFPHPLVSDYSWASIAYRKFSDWDFILSLALHIILLVTCIYYASKKHAAGFALLLYLCFLLPVSNLFFPTGIMMMESNLFHASLGICILLAMASIWLLDYFSLRSFTARRAVLMILLCIVIVLCGAKAWERSRDWKNDVTLFLKDVHTAPNSVLVLGNAGARWIDLADTREITGFSIPGQDTTRFNDYNGTLRITSEEMQEGGYETKREAALYRGIGYLQRAVDLHPRYVNGYLNLGLAYFKLRREQDAILNWKFAEHMYPDNPYLRNYYGVFSDILNERGSKAFRAGNYKEARDAFKKWTIVQPKNAQAWYSLAGVYFNLGQKENTRAALNRSLENDPSFDEAKKMMKMVE
jgi:protein O-mannosyl-transferase